jgi:uncharacterized membrane protein
MNKLLVAVFDQESTANAGLEALRRLHAAGDITLYATGVLARDTEGRVTVRKAMDAGPIGTASGLAIGGLIGLLGGPAGVAIGAVGGSLAGAVRDLWVAGVGVDFIEEVERHLLPGKVALLAELDEEWVIPVDLALEAAGGRVMRRSRNEVAEAQFDHDIAAFKAEITELESEASHAGGATLAKVQAKLTAAKSGLDGAVQRARQRVETLKQEADAKVASLTLQLDQTRGDVRARVEARMKRVTGAYHARGAKLSQAWSLAREALTA